MDDQARALAIVGVLLAGASGSAGFAGGRMSAPVPPAEVRYIPIPAPAALFVPPAAEAEPAEPAPVAPVIAVPIAPAAEAKPPLPAPRPKVEAKPKPTPPKPEVKKPRPVREPTATECAQLRFGLATIGRDGVNQKAADRGYSKAQVAGALKSCGL